MKLTDKEKVWDYSSLLVGIKNDDFSTLRERIKEIHLAFAKKYRNDKGFLEDASKLKSTLDEYEKIYRIYGGGGNETYYFSLKGAIDQNDPVIKGMLAKAEEFAIDVSNEISFFEIELSKIPEIKQKEFVSSPILVEYKHFLERLFAFSKHILSEEEEKIITLKSGVSHGNWTDMTSRFLAKEEREVLNEDGKKELKNFSEILSLFDSKKKEVRDDAAKVFNEILLKHLDSAEAEMNSILENKKINDVLRSYESPQEARILSDDMQEETVETLVSTVTEHFDIPRKFYELKSKLFKVEKLAYHERNLSYGDSTKKYDEDSAFTLVHETLSKINPVFGEIIDKFVKGGSYDVFPKKGKYSGAFCTEGLKEQQTYILLNFTGKLRDVLAIAHESGHGINFELMSRTQNSLNLGTALSTAEVASTFMEDFVLQKLLMESSEEERLYLQLQKLDEDISTTFRQIALYNFELELHPTFRQKGFLTKEEIGLIFSKHMSSYMGDFVEKTKGSENWWVYWSHIRSFFYVYSYANGLLISKALQRKVKTDPKFSEDVVEFLSAGRSLSPYEIFEKMGINIDQKEFWMEGIQEMSDLLDDTTKLAKKLGKI